MRRKMIINKAFFRFWSTKKRY